MVILAYIVAIGFGIFYLATQDVYYLILGLIAAIIAIISEKD
jgi:hypothetical protein